MYMEMFQMGLIDHEEVLKKTDIADREGVLQRIGAVNQLRQQVAVMETQYKQLEGLNQTLRRGLQQTEINLAVERGKDEVQDELRQTGTEQKLARARISDAVAITRDRMKLMEREHQLKLDRQEAEAKIKLMQQEATAKIQATRRTSDG